MLGASASPEIVAVNNPAPKWALKWARNFPGPQRNYVLRWIPVHGNMPRRNLLQQFVEGVCGPRHILHPHGGQHEYHLEVSDARSSEITLQSTKVVLQYARAWSNIGRSYLYSISRELRLRPGRRMQEVYFTFMGASQPPVARPNPPTSERKNQRERKWIDCEFLVDPSSSSSS